MTTTTNTTINTTKGPMDAALLERKDGYLDDANETTQWVEYYHDGELVHRSVSVILKPVAASAAISEL